MAGAEEMVGPDDREAHRVLVSVLDAACALLLRTGAKQARVRGNEEHSVLRIHTEPMNVNGPWIVQFGTGRRCLIVTATADRQDGKDRYGKD